MELILIVIIIGLFIYVSKLRKDFAKSHAEIKKLRKSINTIYMYAALSEEETQKTSLKEKQKIIQEICEESFR